MTDQETTVAVLDDEANFRRAIARLLKGSGCKVELHASGEGFLDSLCTHKPDCLLLDLHMPRMTGFAVLESMAERRISLPVIVCTGQDEPGNDERARSLGAADYLLKPVQRATLLSSIAHACPGFVCGDKFPSGKQVSQS